MQAVCSYFLGQCDWLALECRCTWSPEEGVRPPGDGVKNDYELPEIGARKWVFCKILLADGCFLISFCPSFPFLLFEIVSGCPGSRFLSTGVKGVCLHSRFLKVIFNVTVNRITFLVSGLIM